MKNVKINLKLNDEQKKEFARKLVRNKQLFFIVLVGILLVYSFNVIYKKAFIDINFIEYADDSNIAGNHQESITLEKIIQNIEDRKSNLEKSREKKYKDPFNYQGETADVNTKTSTEIKNNNAAPAAGGSQNNDSNIDARPKN